MPRNGSDRLTRQPERASIGTAMSASNSICKSRSRSRMTWATLSMITRANWQSSSISGLSLSISNATTRQGVTAVAPAVHTYGGTRADQPNTSPVPTVLTVTSLVVGFVVRHCGVVLRSRWRQPLPVRDRTVLVGLPRGTSSGRLTRHARAPIWPGCPHARDSVQRRMDDSGSVEVRSWQSPSYLVIIDSLVVLPAVAIGLELICGCGHPPPRRIST